ncbi:MAG: hypothetical protein EXS64_14590 [Candidatus Latescibacteria bacterium]|nr:hypothetical protein [Candidatus Latescibacterota bacterium]
MEIRFHPHAQKRMSERGTNEEEVKSTTRQGEQIPAKYGRSGFRRNFPFDSAWQGKYYRTKQVETYAG